MPINSLALRLAAGAGFWVAISLLVGGILLSRLFRDYVESNFDARLDVLLESLIAASEVDEQGNLQLIRLVAGEPRFEQVYSGWYWQIYAQGAPMLRSRSLWDQLLPVTERGGPVVNRYETLGPEGNRLRVAERSITLPGSQRIFHYSVAADQREMSAVVEAFDRQLIQWLGLLGLVLVFAVFTQIRYGLGPLRSIRAGLAAIRSGQATRLEGEFPAEIRPLAEEINNLLEHDAAVLERARTQVSNLAHALKTPLSVLINEAAAATGPLAETVRRQTELIRVQSNHYLARARAAATRNVLGARTEVLPVAEDLRRTLERIHRDRQVLIQAEIDPSLHFRGERQDLQEMLGNLLDNACKWGRSLVRLSGARQGDTMALTIEDDGPGLPEEARASVFDRGKRLDESVPGSGLGLAIVRDLAELYAGKISLDASPLGGLRATLVLPAA